MALFAGGMALNAPAFAFEPSYAAMLSNTCNGCHGTSGVSAGPNTPNLAGVQSAYIDDQMKKFRSGERPSTIMGRLAKAYSDDDIAAIGSYFSTQKYVGAKQPVDAAKVAKGKTLHERCKKCHTENGRDSDEGGIVAGQWKEYLQIALSEFRSDKRKMPKKMAEKVMGDNKLSDEDVEALIDFYASQQ
jgi:sulfide dehydrogenase cytochrome subunit